MSVLSQKLQEASKLFQSHNFKKSLEAYQDSIDFCHKTKQDRSVIFNILTTKATLQCILGEYDKALTTLNSVLSKEPCHFLSLLRRSHVYKKQNKLRRALKDLEKIFVFCPDNLQVFAFKAEIEDMLLKQGSMDESSESDTEEHVEETQLNFINLKMIDRKSSDISAKKQRTSRITILGDTTFQYKREEESRDTNNQENQDIGKKKIRTFKEIELDSENQEQISFKIKVNGSKAAKKSILKNKGTSIFIQPEDRKSKKQKYLGRESKLLDLLKNIDGRMIQSSEMEHLSEPSLKEVDFRKSGSQIPLEFVFDPTASVISTNSFASEAIHRKSCLKASSFEVFEAKYMERKRSKFQGMDQSQVDGRFIHHKQKRKSIQMNQGEQKGSDSDNESSSHNIFGSIGVVMSQDLRQKLGISQEEQDSSGGQMTKSLNLNAKESILKKNSSVMLNSKRSLMLKDVKQVGLGSGIKKLKEKKSVVFNCTM